jgi:hypothetical protein
MIAAGIAFGILNPRLTVLTYASAEHQRGQRL